MIPSRLIRGISHLSMTFAQLLTAASFEPQHMSLTPRVTPLASGIIGWLTVFARTSILRKFSDEEATEIMKEVEEICRVDFQDRSGQWAMVYMRLRFSAILH